MFYTTAYEELAESGQVGHATLALLRRLAVQVTRTSSFPPPEGYNRWSDEALDYLLGDMFARAGPTSFVIACFIHADDQASLERLLVASIRNQLIDEAKRTERGKLRRRLQGILSGDDRFVKVGAAEAGVSCWTLADGVTDLWQGDLSVLEKAAADVRGVAVRRWNTSGPTPAATRHALIAVAEGVLRAAGECVGEEDLARIIEGRFALLRPPRFVALETDEGYRLEPADDSGDEPEALVTSQARAEELWESLTPSEWAVVPHLGSSAADVAQVLGVGIARARTVQRRLADKLRMATVDDDDAHDVALLLRQLCQIAHEVSCGVCRR